MCRRPSLQHDASYGKVAAQRNVTKRQSSGCPLRLRRPCGKKKLNLMANRRRTSECENGKSILLCWCIPLRAPGAFSIKGMFTLPVYDIIKVTLLCNGKKAIFNN